MGGLAARAELWPWGTLAMRQPGARRPAWLSDWPVGEPADWTQIVNRPETEAELAALRRCARRGTPYGGEARARQTAASLNLLHTRRPRVAARGREEMDPRHSGSYSEKQRFFCPPFLPLMTNLFVLPGKMFLIAAFAGLVSFGCDDQQHSPQEQRLSAPELPTVQADGPVTLRSVIPDGSTYSFSGSRAAALRRLVGPEARENLDIRPKSERVPAVPHGVLDIDGIEFRVYRGSLVVRGQEADIVLRAARATSLHDVIDATKGMSDAERLDEFNAVIDSWAKEMP